MRLDAITFKLPDFTLTPDGCPIPHRYAVLDEHINEAIDLLQGMNPNRSIESIGDVYMRETILDTGTPLRHWTIVPTEGHLPFVILWVKQN
jgi:hypothetical protein